jgi:hypothetical protein
MGELMKAVTVALVLAGFIAGCAHYPSHESSYPGASPRYHTTKSDCENAGRTWSKVSGDCM